MTRLASAILQWYVRNSRRLPWRTLPNPYRVWISEIMLQQTRVETMLPYYDRWMRRFPTIKHLAAASERAVLSSWEGLGYYSRARNLRRSARIVVTDFDGSLPADTAVLRTLPGIGPYTAAAISSMAYGLDEAAIDSNVSRVLARVFDLEEAVDSSEGARKVRRLARRHLPKGHASEFNQGLMDLGALVCLPRGPRCDACPLRSLCSARKKGVQGERPAKSKHPRRRRVRIAAVVARRANKVLLTKRRSERLLGGLWEFPNAQTAAPNKSKKTNGQNLTSAMRELYGLTPRNVMHLAEITHDYSHLHVTVEAFLCTIGRAPVPKDFRWVKISNLGRYPMGKVDRTIADRLRYANRQGMKDASTASRP